MKRTCKKCGETKPIEEFDIQKDCIGGRRPSCKQCRKMVDVITYKKRMEDIEYKEMVYRKKREWYYKNKEHVMSYDKSYRKKNAEYYKEYGKQYYEKNAEYYKEYGKEYNKKWRESNKQRCRYNSVIGNLSRSINIPFKILSKHSNLVGLKIEQLKLLRLTKTVQT